MYIQTNSYLDHLTNTVYYSSFAGHYDKQPMEWGIEPNSTLLRGFLHAAIRGLERIGEQHGSAVRHNVDLLIGDTEIAKVVEQKQTVSKILHGDDDELWSEFLSKKASLDVRVVTSPGPSEHIDAIWRWNCQPPQPAVLPPIATVLHDAAHDKRPATTVPTYDRQTKHAYGFR